MYQWKKGGMGTIYSNISADIHKCLDFSLGFKVWDKCFIWVDCELVKESQDINFLKQFLNSLVLEISLFNVARRQ